MRKELESDSQIEEDARNDSEILLGFSELGLRAWYRGLKGMHAASCVQSRPPRVKIVNILGKK